MINLKEMGRGWQDPSEDEAPPSGKLHLEPLCLDFDLSLPHLHPVFRQFFLITPNMNS